MRRDVIEYVEEEADDMEDLPECQMYDTGKMDNDDSMDSNNAKLPPELEDGFENLQDSIFIARKGAFTKDGEFIVQEPNKSSDDDRKQANSRMILKEKLEKNKKSKSAEK